MTEPEVVERRFEMGDLMVVRERNKWSESGRGFVDDNFYNVSCTSTSNSSQRVRGSVQCFEKELCENSIRLTDSF